MAGKGLGLEGAGGDYFVGDEEDPSFYWSHLTDWDRCSILSCVLPLGLLSQAEIWQLLPSPIPLITNCSDTVE